MKVNLMIIMMIFLYKGTFLPTIVVTMSEMDIEEDLFESDGTEENNEPQTDEEQSIYEDCERRRCR